MPSLPTSTGDRREAPATRTVGKNRRNHFPQVITDHGQASRTVPHRLSDTPVVAAFDPAHLCLDQALGGDSAYTVFLCARLGEVLAALGDRGYRVIQAEAGIVVGRLQLAAFTLGYGATGLTFHDDEVAAAFGTDTACMMACSVGVPGYQSIPGGPPGRPARLARLRPSRHASRGPR
jgi:hypothetical protein